MTGSSFLFSVCGVQIGFISAEYTILHIGTSQFSVMMGSSENNFNEGENIMSKPIQGTS